MSTAEAVRAEMRPPSRPTPALLELKDITKRFGDVLANDAVDFDLEPGEVHALLGENGAGKSTLMNVRFGLYRQSEGEIVLRGDPVVIGSPHKALLLGFNRWALRVAAYVLLLRDEYPPFRLGR